MNPENAAADVIVLSEAEGRPDPCVSDRGTVPFFPVGAWAALFALTLRQHIRGRRLLVMSLLFALPGVLAAVVTLVSRVTAPAEHLRFAFVLNLIPCALAPLAALLYATGIIQDEVEGQTLTYLLLRPLPRWTIYAVRMLATWLLISALTAAFTAVTLAVIALCGGESIGAQWLGQALKTAAALALAQAGYCGLFGLLGLLMRRSLFVGVAYIFFFEGVLASLDMVVRRLTIMYYFRVLVLRWLNPADGKEWSIDLATAPDVRTCVLTLVVAGAVLTLTAAFLFAGREFRMKTPEGT
jgi:ABC-2 type transport system permease protein